MMKNTYARCLLLVLLMGLGSCSDGASEPGAGGPDEGGPSCTGGCGYSITWPRLIVAMVPPEDSQSSESDLGSVVQMAPDGSRIAPSTICPDLPASLRCDYTYFSTPNEESITLLIEDADGIEVWRSEVPLTEFNRCGIDMAYLEVELNDGAPPQVSDVRYVTPCRTLD